jgi:hypothetical protein
MIKIKKIDDFKIDMNNKFDNFKLDIFKRLDD